MSCIILGSHITADVTVHVLIMVCYREYDKAWKHLAEANQLQRSLGSYDPQHDAMLFQVKPVSSCHPVTPLCS